MLSDDGGIDQEFFKPTKVLVHEKVSTSFITLLPNHLLHHVMPQVVLVDDKKWGNNERDLLYQVGEAIPLRHPHTLHSMQRTTVIMLLLRLTFTLHLNHCQLVCIPFRQSSLAVVQALEKHGIGNWREISEQYLPKWDDQAIRIKASRLMGSRSLARYVGWKGNR